MHVVHEPNAAAESPSLPTWKLTTMGDTCQLRVTHEHLGPATLAYVEGGWEYTLMGLKTLLETGEPQKVGRTDHALKRSHGPDYVISA